MGETALAAKQPAGAVCCTGRRLGGRDRTGRGGKGGRAGGAERSAVSAGVRLYMRVSGLESGCYFCVECLRKIFSK
ncbi:hypothetical protein DB346_19265 [Verrucomicrobia bacterium LW23]|nr:hypothetical protein DB346_19265 [Verrucomicrobia bacterium LW23]